MAVFAVLSRVSSSDSLVRALPLLSLLTDSLTPSTDGSALTSCFRFGNSVLEIGLDSEKMPLTLSAYDALGGDFVSAPASLGGALRRPVFGGLLKIADEEAGMLCWPNGSTFAAQCCFFGGEAMELLFATCRFNGESFGSSG